MLTRILVATAILAVVSFIAVSGQEPVPPPIWPNQFLAKFGLYMFDEPSNSPIFNLTSMFSYNMDDDVQGQLINYPDRCVPIFPNGDETPCNILFLGLPGTGIYWNQPELLGTPCCLLFPDIGPTPRNFTRGFAWNGTGIGFGYDGTLRNSDFWISPDGTFKYWTELETHHDVFFRDGAGAFWAWDHLQVVPVAPSVFDLFSDPKTCNTPCPSANEVERQQIMKRAAAHGPIAMALHHHKMKQQEENQWIENELEQIVEQVEEEIVHKKHNKHH